METVDRASSDKHPHVHVATDASTSDDGSLAFKQTRVRRVFSYLQTMFMALVYMSSWEAAIQNTYAVFYNGGPSSLTWGMLVASIGALAQSASIAEMAGMRPLAGAQYHWTWLVAPPKYRRFVSWMQGWLTWFAWVSLMIGISNVAATIIESVIVLNNPGWEPTRWQTTLLVWAILLVFVLANIFVFEIVPMIETICGALHIVLWVLFLLIFLVMRRGQYNSSSFVWTGTLAGSSASSGWTNSFVQWNLGLLTSTWAFVGFDNTAHLSEEIQRAPKTVPRVMFLSIALNTVPAWVMSIAVLYCLRSLDDATNAPAGFPFTGIVLGVTGSKAATTVLLSTMAVIVLMNVLTTILSVSRLTWAWARDGALPRLFSIVSEKFHIPIAAIILPTVICALISLLNIASSVALQVFIALSTFGLYASYILLIGCMVHARLTRPETELLFGSWNLGKKGMAINVFALVYSLYISIWLVCPTARPITGENMNYALPIFAAFVAIALLLWLGWGRRKWQGINEKVVELALKE